MVESLTLWVVPVHDTRGSETTSLQVWCLKQCHASKTPKLVGDCYSGIPLSITLPPGQKIPPPSSVLF